MSGFVFDRTKHLKGPYARTHRKGHLDYEEPHTTHIDLSEWAFCTSAGAVEILPNYLRPQDIVPQPLYGGNRWTPIRFAYQNTNGTTVGSEFTNDSNATIPNANNPCIRTIMPLNTLWSPYWTTSTIGADLDSKYSGFTERRIPIGLGSYTSIYKYWRIRRCTVTIKCTNYSRELFDAIVVLNRNDINPSGLVPATAGSDTYPAMPPKALVQSLRFVVRANPQSDTFNPENMSEYATTHEPYKKGVVTYYKFTVDIPKFCSDLEWKYDHRESTLTESNFWSRFHPASSTMGRPKIQPYYQIYMKRRLGTDDVNPQTGPTIAIRHNWQVEFGRYDTADGSAWYSAYKNLY